MNNLNTNSQFTAYPRQNDFMIGKPENDKHPLDKISDADLRGVLMASDLSDSAVSEVIGRRGKYRDLLMAIVEAGQKGEIVKVSILADTLAVGMGITDPRQNDNDPPADWRGIPAHAKRSWFNG